MRDFQVYLEDIIDAVDSIEEYTSELTYEAFVKDKKLLMRLLGILKLLVKPVNTFLKKLGWNFQVF